MRDVVKTVLCFALVFCVVLFSGCGKKESEKPGSADTAAEIVEKVKVRLEVDISKAVSAIKAEVGKLDVEQLTALVKKYKSVIEERKVEVEALSSKIQKLDFTGMSSEEGQSLMVNVDNINKAIAALKERFSIYYDKLKELGGDVSGLEVD